MANFDSQRQLTNHVQIRIKQDSLRHLLELASRAYVPRARYQMRLRSSMPSPGQQIQDEQHDDAADDHHEDLPLLRLLHDLLEPADGALQTQPRAAHVLRLRASWPTSLAPIADNEHTCCALTRQNDSTACRRLS